MNGDVRANERIARRGLALLLIPFALLVAFSFTGLPGIPVNAQWAPQYAGALLYLGLTVAAGIVALRTSRAWLALLTGWMPIVVLFGAMFNV